MMNTSNFNKFADNLPESNLVPGIQGDPFDYGAETMDPLTSLAVGSGMSGAIGGAALLNRMRNKKAPSRSKKPTTPKPRKSPALRKALAELDAKAKSLEAAENNLGRANKELNRLKEVLGVKTELLGTAENNLGRVNRELASQRAIHAADVDEAQKALNRLKKEVAAKAKLLATAENNFRGVSKELAAQRATHAAYVDESQKALNILNKELDAKAKRLETAENYPERLKKRYYAAYGKPNERLSRLLSKSSGKANKVLEGIGRAASKVKNPYVRAAMPYIGGFGAGGLAGYAGSSLSDKNSPWTVRSTIGDLKKFINDNPELAYYAAPALLGSGIGGLAGGWKGALGLGLGGLGLGALAKYLQDNPINFG